MGGAAGVHDQSAVALVPLYEGAMCVTADSDVADGKVKALSIVTYLPA